MSLLEMPCKTHRVARVSSAALTNFRNYESASLEFGSQRNIFIGQNGQGKSNLLEAIYLISTTRSFRGAKDAEMSRIGTDGFCVSTIAGEYDEELKLLHANGHRRQAFLNSQKLGKVQDLVGRLPSVCFSSSDLSIASGEPSARRAFLDTELSIASPAYLNAFSVMKRSIEHRNATLRAIREGEDSIEFLAPWDAKVSESGAAVRKMRLEFLSKLEPIASQSHAELSGGVENLSLEYAPSDEASSADELQEMLSTRQSKDIGAGTTTAGPHRDDLLLLVDGKALRHYGSQGQQRTAVLALKLAVTIYWRDELACLPLLLLDDIMSDLDERRREMVLGVSGTLGQVVITATDIGQLPEEVRSGAKVFRVCEGTVNPE